VKVRDGEGVANRIGPEPCASNGEASVGECTGQLWSRERPSPGRRRRTDRHWYDISAMHEQP
jgi:hypothetical protein